MAETTPAEDERPLRLIGDLKDSGLLWLINRVVFHPRGLALALVSDDIVGWSWKLLGDGTEVWTMPAEVDDEMFLAAQATLAEALAQP